MQLEYTVVLWKHEDKEEFRYDMETPGGNLYIPDREVEYTDLHLTTVGINYKLTREEADQLRKDPRVRDVQVSKAQRKTVTLPLYTQSSTAWGKTSSLTPNTLKNWGLLRCYEGTNRANWGANAIASVSGSIKINASGKNVDVVIVDGHADAGHPEFAVNVDGTGGSRLNQYNWYIHQAAVSPGSSSTYEYTPYVNPLWTADGDHGCHVAGTVAGNTQGWARDANIYNINPYIFAPGTSSAGRQFRYIKQWLLNKPVNPITGRKNPTIINCSFGSFNEIVTENITKITFRGVDYFPPFTNNDLANFLLNPYGGVSFYSPAPDSLEATELEELISLGCIVVGAAGNINGYVDVPGGIDYDNKVYWNTLYYGPDEEFYCRGCAPTSALSAIMVGSIGSVIPEVKRSDSTAGPRITVFAPGDNIISSVNSTVGGYANDPRNGAFRLRKIGGTSMASPQVAGMLACLAEIYPRMTQQDAINWLSNYSGKNQLNDSGVPFSDQASLKGAANRYLKWFQERPDNGVIGPKTNYKARPSNGSVFPRTRILRYGS